MTRRLRVGVLEHAGSVLGGAQLVVGHLAALLSRSHDVEVISNGAVPLGALATSFDLDLASVSERRIPELPSSFNFHGARSILGRTDRGTRGLSGPYDLFVYSGLGVPPPCYARRGIVYCHFPMEPGPLYWSTEAPRAGSQNPLARLTRAAAYRLIWHRRMRGYQRIVANSEFTAREIERRWNRPAEVVHPPVDLEVPEAAKQDLIVSVGRFAGQGSKKNQLEQVSVFREFRKQVPGDWVLRVIGSCGACAEDRSYLDSVREAAQGLPVEILPNADRRTVIASLAAAKLFWHTAGLAEDVAKGLARAEHFGIATVEAMRAGCVPVVIASGGQPEIVQEGVSGHLVADLRALLDRSVLLARNPELVWRMSEQARKRSMDFGSSAFEQRMTALISQCLDGLR